MRHLDDWAHLIAKQLKSEAELVNARMKSELYEDLARETFIRVALDSFLPESYAVGCGRVIDSCGQSSSPQDIVVYRKDYPQFNMPGSHDVFIYESVLATIQITSRLVRKSFNNALDQCASLGRLEPGIDSAAMRAMAAKMNLQPDAQHQYVHSEALNTNRFGLIGRPQSFIYAFTGYQTSDRQLSEGLSKWIDLYQQEHDVVQMKSLPSVIATQGCFAWRNTTPFALKGNVLMGVGIDYAPLRLIILQLMHALNRRLQNTSDGYGIKSTLAPYLAQFEPPAISETVGQAVNPGNEKPVSERIKTDTGEAQRAVSPAGLNSELNTQTGKPMQATPAMFARPKIVTRRVDNNADTNESAAPLHRARMAQHKLSSVAAFPGAKPHSAETLKQTDNGTTTSSPINDMLASGAGKKEIPESHPQRQLSRAEFSAGQEDETATTSQIVGNSETDSKATNAKKLADSLPQETDEGDDFIDTLVETAESLANDTSSPASRKSAYVTESLLQ